MEMNYVRLLQAKYDRSGDEKNLEYITNLL